MPKPTAQQLQRINSLVLGTKLSDEDVEVLQFSIFDTKETHYSTVFDTKTLQKYKKDLSDGKVALIELHRQGGSFDTAARLPHGRSFDARLGADGQLSGQFYVPLKDVKGNFRKERVEFVSGIYDGTTFDVSGGIHATRYECSICSKDIRTYACGHWPGQTYEMENDAGVKTQVKCIAYVKGTKTATAPDGSEYFSDVGMSELSGVIDGAVESAHPQHVTYGKDDEGHTNSMVLNGQTFQKCEEDKLNSMILEHNKTPLRFSVGAVEFAVEESAAAEPTEELTAEASDTVLNRLLEKVEECVNLQSQTTDLGNKLSLALAKVVEYERQLSDRKKLDDYLVDLTIQSGIRLHGNAYPVESERDRLSKATAEDLVKFHKELGESVRKKFPHGRQSSSHTSSVMAPALPDHVFKTR